MSSPNDITIDDLTGVFMLDKSISSDSDPLLALQGISWLVRKAIGLATVTTTYKQFLGETPESKTPVVQVLVSQSTGTRLGGTTDTRYMDWVERPGEDHIFGKTNGKSRIVGGEVVDGKARPVLEVQIRSSDPNVEKFLRGEIDADLKPCDGFIVEKSTKEYPGVKGENGVWMHVVIENQSSGWLAEQVWGFEVINNERYHTRRTVISDKKGKFQLGRLVYTFKGHSTD